MVFTWSSHGLRMVFARVCGVSSASPPLHSPCAPRMRHTTALHLIGTLPRPKWLRRFGGANAPLGDPLCPAEGRAQGFGRPRAAHKPGEHKDGYQIRENLDELNRDRLAARSEEHTFE